MLIVEWRMIHWCERFMPLLRDIVSVRFLTRSSGG